jgi:hypothetical protein
MWFDEILRSKKKGCEKSRMHEGNAGFIYCFRCDRDQTRLNLWVVTGTAKRAVKSTHTFSSVLSD